MTKKVTLLVNQTPIPLDYFVEGFMDHVVSGMIEALEGTGEIKNLSLSIEGSKVAINLNGAPVPVNAFASKIIRSTAVGVVSPLKGVKEINQMQVNIAR